MITDITTLRASLKAKGGKKPLWAGVVLYEGPSLLDGAPIVLVATKIMSKSRNGKTGHMVQSYIIRSDVKPHHALKTGADASVCGTCIHRPLLAKANGHAPCYVQVAKSVLSVYETYKRDRYARAGIDFDVSLVAALFEGLAFRMGTYGDPAAAPFMVWRRATVKAAFVNGYTHQWRDSRFHVFRMLCMASADNETDRDDAHAAGWRTFHVHNGSKPLDKRVEIACPASKESGYRTDCASCKACGGLSAKAKVSIAIMAHGAGSSSYLKAAA